MKDTKTEFKYFTIPEWKEEQDYLRQQHQNGWEFVGVNFIGFYHFEKCEPADVIYQLDYNPDGRAHKKEYIQMFRDCGWEYLQDFVGYSYFRKAVSEMNDEEEIFCDDSSRLDMMKRVLRGRMLPLLPLFLLIVVFTYMNPIDTSLKNLLIFVVVIIYLSLFLRFGYQYWKCWKSQH